MAARHRKMKYASGGEIKGVSVPGASIMREAESANEGFKRGGKSGTMAKGGKAKARMDKAPRKAAGGPVKLARGGSPYSAAGKGGKDAPDSGSECS
jgi:hypothetical protein